MSLDISETTWKYFSEALDKLLRGYVETIIKLEITKQSEKIQQFHDMRLDPLEFHELNFMETQSESSQYSKDSLITLEEEDSQSKLFGIFEFISEFELNRFSLGKNPPKFIVLNVEECTTREFDKVQVRENWPVRFLKQGSTSGFGPMSNLAEGFYQSIDHKDSVKQTKIHLQKENKKSVIGSKKLPSRMNQTQVENVDYSTIDKNTVPSPIKKIPPMIKDLIESLGNGVSTRFFVEYDSNAEIDIDTVLAFNEPVLRFIEIPIGIRLKKVKIAAEIVVSYKVETDALEIYLEKTSTLPDKNLENTPIQDFNLTIDIGDPNLGPLLRDTEKIANFTKEIMQTIFKQKLLFPQQVRIKKFLRKILKTMNINNEHHEK